VLASCTAGWSEIRPGDELIGLSAAVLALGTAAVLAPLLPVPDTATRPVVLAVHRALADGACPSAALAAAGPAGTPDPAGAGDIGRLTAAAFLCLGAG
jgi:CHAT domain-containing protein